MNEEQQRIAILEALGWTELRHHEVKKKKQPDGEIKVTTGPWHALWGTDPEGRKGRYCPNHLVNLNACAEMEKSIHLDADGRALPKLWRTYRDELAKVIGCAWYQSSQLLRATAPQRCEAFLKVKNLWA